MVLNNFTKMFTQAIKSRLRAGRSHQATRPYAAAIYRNALLAHLLIFAVLLTPLPTDAAAHIGLSYLTEEYYPFNYTDEGDLKGISVDLLRLTWKELGQEPHPITAMPWARAYDRACNVSTTVLFSMARTPQRENMFRWAGPIMTVRFVLIAQKRDNITLDTISDAEGYRIGTLRDDITDALLQQYSNANKVEAVADMSQNIRKLMDDRLDMVAYEEHSWKMIALKNGLDPDEFETVFVLRETPVYYAFHRDTPPPVVREFQKALDRVKARPEYEQILNTYLR